MSNQTKTASTQRRRACGHLFFLHNQTGFKSWHRSELSKIFYLLCTATLGLGFASHENSLFAQQQTAGEPQITTSDSLLATWNEAASYDIDRLRLIRWIRAHQDSIAPALFSQLVELISEANEFVKQNDYVTAQLLLDTALGMAGLKAAPTMPNEEPAPLPLSNPTISISSPTWLWRREVITGVDWWRQELAFGFAGDDTLYMGGNPFLGLRLFLNRNAGMPTSLPGSIRTFSSSASQLKQLEVSASAMIKTSRDYFNGELEIRSRQALGGGGYWRLENRLEGIRYRRDFDLQYWQNTTTASVVAALGNNFRLEVGDDFRIRRHQAQSAIYPNYIQNQTSFGASFNAGYATRLDSRYNFVVRLHDLCPSADYIEHRVEASIFQNTASNSAILIENIWRYRIYPTQAAGDSCLYTYRNTYQEEYARADLRLGLSGSMGLRLEGDFILRQHQHPSETTPDFLQTAVNPQLQLKLFSDWQLNLGYLYLLRVHEKDIIQLQPSTAADVSVGISEEDYYSHGFTFGIDLIRAEGLLLNLKEVYEVRTYPNAADKDLFYIDSNINSLLLFLSWNFLPRWQLGVLANFDNDRSRTDTPRDSRYSLFSIDLGYSF